jgi:hypothetical protein
MLLAATLPDDRRERDRLAVGRSAVLRIGDSAETVDLLDLTAGGCRFASETALPLFARVSIGIAGVGHTLAHVIWQAEGTYGCAFERPLPNHAVTVQAPDNIARIMTATSRGQALLEGQADDDHEKLPLRTRVAIMAGLAGLSWGAVIVGARAVFDLLR